MAFSLISPRSSHSSNHIPSSHHHTVILKLIQQQLTAITKSLPVHFNTSNTSNSPTYHHNTAAMPCAKARTHKFTCFDDMKKQARKAHYAQCWRDALNPMPPKPVVAKGEVAIQSMVRGGLGWSVQKSKERNQVDALRERKRDDWEVRAPKKAPAEPEPADYLPGDSSGDESSDKENHCGSKPTGARTSGPARGNTGRIVKKQEQPKLFMKKAKTSTGTDKISPRIGEGLKKVKASRVMKGEETVVCGGLRDDSGSRGMRYTVKRTLYPPTELFELGGGDQ